MKKLNLITLLLILNLPSIAQEGKGVANQADYLQNIKTEMQKQWPNNRTINIVFHGHSVPSGYFLTPIVNSLDAYPQVVYKKIKELYPYAVVNCIVTAIGGENSEQGAKRLKHDVLDHHPDLVFIDYALNDRGIGLDKAKTAWSEMIAELLKENVKVILLTASPDKISEMFNPNDPLNKQCDQITELAKKYNVGLVDSYSAFKKNVKEGKTIGSYMSQMNHPNKLGHQIIAEEIFKWFE